MLECREVFFSEILSMKNFLKKVNLISSFRTYYAERPETALNNLKQTTTSKKQPKTT